MQPVKICENIYWVGGIDWDLRNFHGYLTQRGSTYNAYLIIDEKITLIDTVKYYLVDEMLKRVSQIVDPAKIDIVISNHVEMDHSGGLPRLMELCPNATIYTSEPNGMKGLKRHYKQEWNFQPTKTGESISLGKRSLHFVQTQMVHWPDNMVTYCPEEKILFSNDAFGQHIASEERFDDQLPLDIIMEEAKKYYGNIVLPYGFQTQNALKAVAGLDIEMIAPSHGILWRKHIPEIIAEYQKWSTNTVREEAVIVYDSMWKSTRMMALAIADGFAAKGIPVKMRCLQASHISDIMTDIVEAKYICVGSPTLNNNMLPTVASFLTYLKGLAPKNRVGLAFGSYGWGGQSIAQVESVLVEMKCELLDKVRIQYVPDEDELKALTDQIAAAL